MRGQGIDDLAETAVRLVNLKRGYKWGESRDPFAVQVCLFLVACFIVCLFVSLFLVFFFCF